MFDSIQFLPNVPDSSILYFARYRPEWVVVSVLIAIFSSYTALISAASIQRFESRSSKLMWVIISALAMGIGTWAMHFIGMLALRLPCGINYDPFITAVSMIPGVLGGGMVFGIVWRNELKRPSPLMGSILLGSCVGAMHYSGMAAMHIEGVIRYDPLLFGLSIVVAIALSYLALRVKDSNAYSKKHGNVLTAVILGCAVSGMHYTAMFATYFVKGGAESLPPSIFSPDNLATIVTLTTVVLTFTALALLETLNFRESELRENDRKLQESEAHLRAIVDNEPECIKIIDARGRLIQMNPAGLTMLEADSVDQLAGSALLHVVAPEYRTAFIDMHKRVLAGESVEMEFQVNGLKGGHRWLYIHAVPMQSNGETVLLGVTRDITDRKLADYNLHQSETKYRTLFDASGDAVLMLRDGRFIDCNNAAMQLFGIRTRDDFLLHHLADFSPSKQLCGSDSMVLAEQYIATAMTSGNCNFEWVHQRVDTGERFNADVQLHSMMIDGNLVLQATVRDITKRKLAEDELRIAATTFETHEAIMITDANANIVRVNKSFEKITGYSESEVIGKNPRILSSGRNDKAFYIDMWREIIATGTWSGEVWDKHKNGGVYPKQLTITAVKNKAGETTQYVAIFIEITERKNAEARIRQTEGHLSTILNSLDELIWTASAPDFNLHHVSSATEKLYGVSQQAFIDDPELWLKSIHPDDKALVEEATRKILQTGRTEIEYRIIRSDGQERWLSDRMYVMYDEQGKPSELVGIAYDVTERKLTLDALKASEERAKQSLAELQNQKFALDKHAIVAVTDVRGRITHANEKFCEISGYSHEELIGQDHAILNSGYHPKGFFKEMYRVVASGKPWHDEVCNRAKDGHLYWVDTTIAPFMGENGKPHSYISIRTDITNRKSAEDKSNYLALYDTLTQLPNRRLLMDRLNQAIAASARSGRSAALLFLDLDHFKTLNDTLGHDIGDALLQQVATRLTSCVREGDTVARLGGDEFVVLLEDLSEQTADATSQAEEVGEKILAILNQNYHLGTHVYRNTSSIGATLVQGHALTVDELIKQADIAMYQAKQAGRNALRFFDPEMQENISARADLEHELRKAIDTQQFQLHYQVQVDSSGRPFGAEALIRWNHPERGMISPFNFIPLAEETSLILPIGQWVLETACAQLKQWEQNPEASKLILAVNVSAKQFHQPDFASQVKSTVQRYDIDPMRLKLELTESLLADNIEGIIATMHAIKAIGIQFSLDDFGTGYSSLQYLKMLPLDQLKIDQSFVRDIAVDISDKAIALTIITMAHILNLDVIAEGVETEEQRQLLLDNDCNHYQGYLFSKPLPIDAFEQLLLKS